MSMILLIILTTSITIIIYLVSIIIITIIIIMMNIRTTFLCKIVNINRKTAFKMIMIKNDMHLSYHNHNNHCDHKIISIYHNFHQL